MTLPGDLGFAADTATGRSGFKTCPFKTKGQEESSAEGPAAFLAWLLWGGSSLRKDAGVVYQG